MPGNFKPLIQIDVPVNQNVTNQNVQKTEIDFSSALKQISNGKPLTKTDAKEMENNLFNAMKTDKTIVSQLSSAEKQARIKLTDKQLRNIAANAVSFFNQMLVEGKKTSGLSCLDIAICGEFYISKGGDLKALLDLHSFNEFAAEVDRVVYKGATGDLHKITGNILLQTMSLFSEMRVKKGYITQEKKTAFDVMMANNINMLLAIYRVNYDKSVREQTSDLIEKNQRSEFFT
ncbi:MAG: hypothetical protein QW568_02300 [Candidatus Anstonellaceae archaeon]